MADTKKFIIDENDGGRLDKTLAVLMPEVSRSYLQKLMEQGLVTVNGSVADKKTKASSGDIICVDFPDSVKPEIVPENIPLDIPYEDSDLLVVNKPKGMVVHPAAPRNSSPHRYDDQRASDSRQKRFCP